MWKADIIIGFSLLLFSVISLVEAMRLPQSHVGLSPGLFPSIAFVGLILLGFALGLRGLKERKGRPQAPPATLDLSIKNIGKIAIFGIFAWLYVLLLRPLGFVYASGIFFWVVFILAGMRHWGKALVFSFGSSIAVYLIFYRIFMVVLPRPTVPIPHPF